jgi:hypothetical protein
LNYQLYPPKLYISNRIIPPTNTTTNKTNNHKDSLSVPYFPNFSNYFFQLTKQLSHTKTMAPDLITAATNITNAQGKATKRAFVTFLAGNGDYVKGVVGLAKGLRKVKTMYPLVVAVLPDVPVEHRNILTSQGCIVREIEPVYPPENQTQFAMAYYVINYSKLRIWAVSNLSLFYSPFLTSS